MSETESREAVRARTTSEPLDPEALRRSVRSDADGAVVVFVGTVRDHNEGRAVTGLRYECYAEMADAELEAIAREARSRWPIGRVAVEHRVGELEIGDVSVVVAVAAPHRAPCYDASRYVMEAIKARLPVWKRESYADGSESWVAGSDPVDADGVTGVSDPGEDGAGARPGGPDGEDVVTEGAS